MISFGKLPDDSFVNSVAIYRNIGYQTYYNFNTQDLGILYTSTEDEFLVPDKNSYIDTPTVDITSPIGAEIINFYSPVKYQKTDVYKVNNIEYQVYDINNNILESGWEEGVPVTLVIYNNKLYYSLGEIGGIKSNTLYMNNYKFNFEKIVPWDKDLILSYTKDALGIPYSSFSTIVPNKNRVYMIESGQISILDSNNGDVIKSLEIPDIQNITYGTILNDYLFIIEGNTYKKIIKFDLNLNKVKEFILSYPADTIYNDGKYLYVGPKEIYYSGTYYISKIDKDLTAETLIASINIEKYSQDIHNNIKLFSKRINTSDTNRNFNGISSIINPSGFQVLGEYIYITIPENTESNESNINNVNFGKAYPDYDIATCADFEGSRYIMESTNLRKYGYRTCSQEWSLYANHTPFTAKNIVVDNALNVYTCWDSNTPTTRAPDPSTGDYDIVKINSNGKMSYYYFIEDYKVGFMTIDDLGNFYTFSETGIFRKFTQNLQLVNPVVTEL